MTLAGLALTDRELELVRLLSLGYTNTEAAGRMHVSPSTVRTKIDQIAVKMGLDQSTDPGSQRTPGVLRAQIVRHAYHIGLIS